MIKRTLIAFAVIFAAYTAFIINKPSLHASQHQWQDNTIKAERYIYTDSINKVIVGSSLSCRMVMDLLPGVYNLALNGQSVFEGLELIRYKKQLPKVVYIETNVIFRQPRKDFTPAFFSPITYYSKKYIPSLFNDKQPLALSRNYFKSISDKLSRRLGLKKKQVYIKKAVFNKILQTNIGRYAKFSDKDLEQQFAVLRGDVKYLKGKGVKVVFFEMPVDPRIADQPLAAAIRSKMYTYFPEKDFRYIKLPANAKQYSTTDGIHLRAKDAMNYTRYFKQQYTR